MKPLFAIIISILLVAASIFLFRHKTIDLGRPYFEKGLELYQLSDHDCTWDWEIIKKAIPEFEKAIDKGYKEREVFDKLASCYRHSNGDVKNAEIIYSRALTYYPDDYEFYIQRGDCRKSLKKYEDALKDYEKATSIKNAKFRDNYSNVIYDRGAIKYILGDTINAEADRKLATNILRDKSGRSDVSFQPYK